MTTTQQNHASDIDAAVKLVRYRRPLSEVANVLVFEDREGYLFLVAEWKARYASISRRIRAEKRIMRGEGENDGFSKSTAQSTRESLRTEARALIAVRKASKLRAAAQWEAGRRTAAA